MPSPRHTGLLSELTEKQARLVEFYANPNNRETFRKKMQSLRAAGYSESMVHANPHRIFRSKKVKHAIAETFARYRVDDVANESGDPDVDYTQMLLKRMLDVDLLDLFEVVEWTEEDKRTGELVKRRELQIKDILDEDNRIDGRVLQKITISNSQKGQNVTFEIPNKVSVAQLLARLKGYLGEGRGGQQPINLNIDLRGSDSGGDDSGRTGPRVINPKLR